MANSPIGLNHDSPWPSSFEGVGHTAFWIKPPFQLTNSFLNNPLFFNLTKIFTLSNKKGQKAYKKN
jgi:hypothetical protein